MRYCFCILTDLGQLVHWLPPLVRLGPPDTTVHAYCAKTSGCCSMMHGNALAGPSQAYAAHALQPGFPSIRINALS